MVQLIVRPIDLSAPGSYRDRKRFLRLVRRLKEATASKDTDTTLEVFDEADTLIVGRLKTDDGSPVEEALDQLSAKQFDELLSAIAFENGEAVGEASATPSETTTGGVAAADPSAPKGSSSKKQAKG